MTDTRSTPTSESVEAAALIYEDCRARGQTAVESLRKALKRLIVAPSENGVQVTDEMVTRFLSWKLPKDFHPDAGISFTPEFNVEYNAKRGFPPQRHEPSGTNLLNGDQAKAMLEHVLCAQSESAPIDQGTEKILRDLLDRIYKMNLMAIPALRVTEQDKHSNDPLVAWMSDVRAVLYGGTKPVPDVIRDLQGPKP